MKLGAKSGHTIRLRTKKASARYKTVLLTKRTSSAVMPGATSIARATIARGVGAVWSRGDARRRCSKSEGAFRLRFRYKEMTRSFHSHPTVVTVVRMISLTNLSMFSYPIIVSAPSASSKEKPAAGSSYTERSRKNTRRLTRL